MSKLKAMAKRVAASLMADATAAAKAGEHSVINIDTIRKALRSEPECPQNRRDFEALEEMTTRCVIELVG